MLSGCKLKPSNITFRDKILPQNDRNETTDLGPENPSEALYSKESLG
jgi:hypothetical protein